MLPWGGWPGPGGRTGKRISALYDRAAPIGRGVEGVWLGVWGAQSEWPALSSGRRLGNGLAEATIICSVKSGRKGSKTETENTGDYFHPLLPLGKRVISKGGGDDHLPKTMLCARLQFWELRERTKMLCKKKRERFRNMKWGTGTGWSHRTKMWADYGSRKGR